MKNRELNTKHINSIRVLNTAFFLNIALPSIAMASTATANKTDNPRGFILAIALFLIMPFWAYTANKWRLWIWGFKVGYADGGGFVSALKWTIYSVVASAIIFGIAIAILKIMS